MTRMSLTVGFIPLVDAAPLIVAHEMGFAAQEGLQLELRRAPSWSCLRDLLETGPLDAAHMLAPIPVASALGLGSATHPLEALMVTSVSGNVIGVGPDLADRMAGSGFAFDFSDPHAAGRAMLDAATQPLRIGVPFPFSMHTELVHHWLSALESDPDRCEVRIRTVPPALMADALRSGEVDAFCVGEPWGSISVDHSQASLLLPGAAIWPRAPEKVLAVRKGWAEENEIRSIRLVRAVWRACHWLASPEARLLAAEILSRPPYLDLPAEMIDRALSGTLTVTPQGVQRTINGFVDFHSGHANLPLRSQAQWIAAQLASRHGLDLTHANECAQSVFRPDLYQSAVADLAPNPRLTRSEGPASQTANPAPDHFFDGQFCDPTSGS